MPEGDTIHKIARALAPLLVGHALTEVYVRGRGTVPELAGATVDEVAAIGKHMLTVIGGRHVLHTHLGMRGKWYRQQSGRPSAPPSDRTVVSLVVGDERFVARDASVAELLRRIDLRTHPRLSRLGPDLLGEEDLDPAELGARFRARGADRIDVADALLDQTIACGIGNVYKSEILFLEGIHPRRPARALADETIAALYARARTLMQRNLGGWKRTTTFQPRPGVEAPPKTPRLWVYERSGEACLRCGARVRSALQGDQARTTYWCPTCQPA